MSILGNNLLAQYYAQNQGLPFGYEAVEYLESTGTQYIDTNYAFQDDFTWEIDFEGMPSNTTLFGGRTVNIRTAVLFRQVGTRNLYINIAQYNANTTPFYFSVFDFRRHKIKAHTIQNVMSSWLDGILVHDNISFTGNYISGVTQTIFADNIENTVSEFTSSKVFAMTMWQGGNTVRNFIPCIRKSESKPGLYDLCRSICPLTGTPFYINAGTGEFVTP